MARVIPEIEPRETTAWLRATLRLGVGLFVAAVVLRTWIVLGLLVPVEVVGDSMAPTLLGPHRVVTCGNCGHQQLVGNVGKPQETRFECPVCGHVDTAVVAGPLLAGDRVLIDRTTFQFRQPRRWEVVVLRHPERPTELCVKRVVGLPGEKVQIRHGDVYVDGRICRKGLSEQRAVRQRVHRSLVAGTSRRWLAEANPSGWHTDGDRWSYSEHAPVTSGASTPPAGSRPLSSDLRVVSPPIDWIRYQHPHDRPVCDEMAYNQSVTRKLNDVTDLMLSCRAGITDAVTDPAGCLLLSANDGRDTFEIEIDPAARQMVLRRNDRVQRRITADEAALAEPTLLEFSLFDCQVLLAVDGQTRLVYPYDPGERPRQPTSRPLAVGARAMSLEVSELTVWRDLYYGWPAAGGDSRGLSGPVHLAGDEYYVLGDNSPISLDSRHWREPGVRSKLLLGKPLWIH